MFLRLFEQPETPVVALREAMRLNGPMLFNQDCRGYVMDCGLVDRVKAPGDGVKRRYLAGGILRTEVEAWSEACRMGGLEVGCIQISAVSTLNAFEYACPEAFAGSGFLVLDLGQTGFTIMAGSGGELMLLRVLEGGGRALMEELSAGGAVPEARVFAELAGVGMRERVRVGVAGLVRQVLASVGFLESRVGGDVTRVHVSGGKWGGITGVLSEELQMECVPWDPLGDGLPSGAPAGLHAACGAALQVLGVPAD
jgi:Tfp pilus assembly PilM family ATPase